MEISKDFASESGHWYDEAGEPRYTIVGKNGKERATTLRDAREFGYYPSVSAIIKCASADGLERWKREQLLLSALTLPRIDGEQDKDFIARVYEDSKEQAKKAAELGKQIHAAVEKYFSGMEVDPDYRAVSSKVFVAVFNHFGLQDWHTEKSFTNRRFGYGGKVDLHSDTVVIDFKTKEFDADNLPKGYDENCMQLAAYAKGLFGGFDETRCANVFISTSVHGLIHICEWKRKEIERGWSMFAALLDYWKHKTGHFPK